MKQKLFLWGTLFFFGAALPLFAAESVQSIREKTRARYEEELENLDKEMARTEQEQLEGLKKRNPTAYQEVVRKKSITQKISEVVSAFRTKKLSEAEARNRLTPLVRQQVDKEVEGLDQEIAGLTKRLEHLRKMKANPSLLVKEKIDIYLGKIRRAEEEFSIY